MLGSHPHGGCGVARRMQHGAPTLQHASCCSMTTFPAILLGAQRRLTASEGECRLRWTNGNLRHAGAAPAAASHSDRPGRSPMSAGPVYSASTSASGNARASARSPLLHWHSVASPALQQHLTSGLSSSFSSSTGDSDMRACHLQVCVMLLLIVRTGINLLCTTVCSIPVLTLRWARVLVRRLQGHHCLQLSRCLQRWLPAHDHRAGQPPQPGCRGHRHWPIRQLPHMCRCT